MSEPESTGEPEALPPPPIATPVVVPRWVQLVLLPLLIVVVWVIAKAAGTVLLLFIAAAVVALILNPAVSFVQHRGAPRAVAVVTVYLAIFTAFGGIGVLLANPVSDQASTFQRDVPQLVDSANKSLADLDKWLNRRGIHAGLRKQGETALETLQGKFIKGSGDVISFTGGLLKTLVTASFGLILIFVLSIYMLIYGERIGELVRSVMPPGDGTPDDDYPTRVQRAVSGYVRGQLLFSVVMGTSAGVGLYVLGVTGVFPDGSKYALVLGAFYGAMELVPFVGPFLGALPAMLIALFNDPITAVWVGLFFLALQQLEGHFVAPQIFGKTLRINPLLVIFALLLGGEVYGIVGALVALPIAAIARETAIYLRRHLVLEPWDAGALP